MKQSSIFSSTSTRRNPDAISRRAFEIWNEEGQPEGCDLRHWLLAEQELSAENAQSDGDPVREVSGNGNGTGNGNGHGHDSTAAIASTRGSSISDPESSPAQPEGKAKRSSTSDTPGKTSARSSTPKRKSTGSGRGPSL